MVLTSIVLHLFVHICILCIMYLCCIILDAYEFADDFYVTSIIDHSASGMLYVCFF